MAAVEAAYATLKAELDPEADAPTEPGPGLDRDGLPVWEIETSQGPLVDRFGSQWIRTEGGFWSYGGEVLSAKRLVRDRGPIRAAS